MPTISFSLKDLQDLVGKKISLEELPSLLEYAKADFEGYDKETDEVRADFGDTNMPYLWSVEGVARLLKGIVGRESGIPSLTLKKGKESIIVENTVTKVRPYIAAFVAKNCVVNNYLIKQLIQLQEKLCETYGMRRKKVAVGVYSYAQIAWPVRYKAVIPAKTSFIPLESRKEMSLKEILESHPKGKEYAWILQGQPKYPLLVDSNKSILSFPPIIN